MTAKGTAGQEKPKNPLKMSYQEFAPAFLNIRTKLGGIVPFTLNKPQQIVEGYLQKAKQEGKPGRFLILKARQLGISTFSLGRMYRYAGTKRGTLAFLAAHDDESTRDLFDVVRLMYDLAPEPRPMVAYNNRTELDFQNPDKKERRDNPGLLSRIRIGTAGKTSLGRSKTIHYLHGSEVAFWKDARKVLLGLLNSVPDTPDSVVILESTANGVGGEFYNLCMEALDPDKRSDWELIFLPWFLFDEYSRPLVGDELEPMPKGVDDIEGFLRYEEQLAETHKLTREQINWRRWAIQNRCGGKVEQFMQEYPSTPREAFITSGTAFFDRIRIEGTMNALKKQDRLDSEKVEECRKKGLPIPVGRFERGYIKRDARRRPYLDQDPEGKLWVYRRPEMDREYLIAADTASGEAVNDDPDFCGALVFDRHTWEHVATFRERCTPHTFAINLVKMGYWYNKAEIAPEINNHGHTVVTLLEQWRYPKVYVRRVFDRIEQKHEMRYGWETNAKTRPLMLDSLASAIDNRLMQMNCLLLLDEMLTFFRHEKTGKPQAIEGCHDDLVIPAAIGAAILEKGDKPQKSKREVEYTRLKPQQAMMKKHIDRMVEEQRNRSKRRNRYF